MSAPTTVRALVLAKAPVPGVAKTRLGADLGMERAADLAAAALLDTLAACAEAFGVDACRLALAGDLAEGARADDLLAAVAGWTVVPQRGEGFAERLANAHKDMANAHEDMANAHQDMANASAGVVQVGMDTPQATARMLREVADGLAHHDAVLGPAEDGGWWVLGLRDPGHGAVLGEVPMSTDRTGAATRDALAAAGLRVGTGPMLRDVDTVVDAEAVAGVAPDSEFTRAWAAGTVST